MSASDPLVTDGWVWPPESRPPESLRHTQAGGLRVRHPGPDLECADDLVASLHNAARGLAAIPWRERVTILGMAGESFVTGLGDKGLRNVAENAGLSPAMAAEVVEGMAGSWSTGALEGLVRAEFPDPRVLDGFAPGSGRAIAAAAPGVTLHLGAGTVPGVTVTSMVRALLVKSPVLAKPGAEDVVLTTQFARHLGRVDPRLGAAVAVQYWPGGVAEWAPWEQSLFGTVDQVVVYGSDATIESVRARAPASTRLIEHGHRIGVAVVNASVARDAAADAARAVALFDQMGCVSPHLFFVLGDRAAARLWSGELADALSAMETELPAGKASAGQLSAMHQLRGRLAMSAAASDDIDLWHEEGASWTVVLGTPEAFQPTGGRTAWVLGAPDPQACLEALSPLSPVLQTVGIAGIREERRSLVQGLVQLGATRIVPLSEVPFPRAEWLHDGNRPLGELVRWIEFV